MGGGGAKGGNPATIADGGAQLKTSATSVSGRSKGAQQAGSTGSSAAGDASIGAAITRFAAAAGAMTDGLAEQLQAAALLATNASKDLSTAGGH